MPPALARAQCRNIKTSRGPLLILVAGLVAAIAYFVTGSSAPPPDTGREPNLATIELKPSIAPHCRRLKKSCSRPNAKATIPTLRRAGRFHPVRRAIAFLPVALKAETIMMGR